MPPTKKMIGNRCYWNLLLLMTYLHEKASAQDMYFTGIVNAASINVCRNVLVAYPWLDKLTFCDQAFCLCRITAWCLVILSILTNVLSQDYFLGKTIAFSVCCAWDFSFALQEECVFLHHTSPRDLLVRPLTSKDTLDTWILGLMVINPDHGPNESM